VSQADNASDLALSLELADIADRIANARFGAVDLAVDLKPNGSPVCDADWAIEAVVADRLQEIHPALPIFGQEQGPAYDGAKTYWAIDPIDGTAAFIAGKTGWGFTACLVRDGEPVVAVAPACSFGIHPTNRYWLGSQRLGRTRGAVLSGRSVVIARTLLARRMPTTAGRGQGPRRRQRRVRRLGPSMR
jgi:histidinol-phosphatase